MAVRAAVYARISMDRTGAELGVTRQRDDCRSLAESKGWHVVDEFVDNDVSASTGKVRPEYQRLLQQLQAGRLDAVVVWDVDRLTRRPIEIEEFLEIADDHNVALACVGGEIDIGSDMGRVQLRVGAAFARGEVDKKARRQRRQRQQAAEAGEMVGGRRAFGYTANGLTTDPTEAPFVAGMYERFAAGMSLGGIARWLNDEGLTTGAGRPWRYQSVRTVLANPRNAGLRGVRQLLPGRAGRAGRRETWHSIVGDAVWPAIVSRDQWEAVMVVLKNPARGEKHVGNRQRYLLSGIAECGTCGAPLITGRRAEQRILRCPSLRHVSRRAEPIEEYAMEVVFGALAEPEALDSLARKATPAVDVAALGGQARELKKRRLNLVQNYADVGIEWADVVTITRGIDDELSAIDAQLSGAMGGDPGLELLDADDVQGTWERWPLQYQRSFLLRNFRIVVGSGRSGRPGGKRFDPDTVTVTWRD